MLTGVRFDGTLKANTAHVTVALVNDEIQKPNGTTDFDLQVSYIADDRGTEDVNEADTKLTVAGENIPLGDLLGPGTASKAAAAADGAAGEFVKEAVDLLTDLLTEAELYAKYQAAAPADASDAERSVFDARLNSIAERAQGAVDTIFGTHTEASAAGVTPVIAIGEKRVDITADGILPTEAAGAPAADYIRATQTVRGLNRLLDALSSADAFVDATKDGNNGVFENALLETAARDAFSANKSEFEVYFGTTATTRYGAIALKERRSKDYTDPTTTTLTTELAAVYPTRYAFDGSPAAGNDEEVGRVGAFSYANVKPTLRSRDLSPNGSAVYKGGTVAVTPGGTLYRGDMQIDVNFRQQSVFGRVSELKDKDNNLWKYLDSEVATIYLPKQNYNNLTQFGGVDSAATPAVTGEDPRRGGSGAFQTATLVYSNSQGFSTTPTEQPKNARFAGRFIGEDGAEITGTWSLGQPEEGGATPHDTKSDNRDVIFGSYGVTREAGDVDIGPADGTAGGAVKTTVVLPVSTPATHTPSATDPRILGATFEGDKDVAGILRLGKRSTGGGKDENNDFDLKTIFAQPGAENPKNSVNKSPTHVDVVVAHIRAQRAIYVIYAEQVGGDSADTADLANVGRQNAWKSINDFVRDHIFDLAAIAPTGTGTPPIGGGPAPILVTDPTDVQNLSSPLGSYFYPMTRNNKPDDEAALERIDRLLAAFDDVHAFEAAVKDDGGGVFDSQPVIDKGSPDPFLWEDNKLTAPVDTANSVADVFGRITSQTRLWSLSTDYTRFGVWYRRETASAVHKWDDHATPFTDDNTPADGRDADGSEDDGSTSPGSYAYSWLDQAAYRTDRPVSTYPSNGRATYEGRTLAITTRKVYMGDALVRVTWKPLSGTTATSTIVPIFSNFRRTDDNTLDRLIHDSKVVDEVVFRATGDVDLILTAAADGKLGISTTAAEAFVSYTDGTRSTATPASTFMAKFVGSSGDGPLGVLGTWRVPGFAGTASADNDLFGSFGADLTSFETLLP